MTGGREDTLAGVSAGDGERRLAALRRWRIWAPLPVLLLAVIGLWLADLREPYESLYLQIGLNLVFSTLAGLLVAVLFGRSFLTHGTPGLLLFGGGAVIWAAAGVTSLAPILDAGHGFDANLPITIHNICIWAASFCQLAGAALLLRWRSRLPARWLWLAGASLAAAATVGFVVLAALAGWTPVFFVQGAGGTEVRGFLLGSTIIMLALTVALLRTVERSRQAPFLRWYAPSLLLLAISYAGLMLESVFAGALFWGSNVALYLGGVYMVMAALAAFREDGGKMEVLVRPRDDAEHPYGIAVALVLVAAALRLVFLQNLESGVLFITFYPAVMLAALYGGLWPGLLAAVFSALLADYFFLEPLHGLLIAHPSDWLALAIFLVNGVLVSWVADRLRRAEAIRREELERLVNDRTAALIEARMEADRANAAKSHFLAAASHDLRQPAQALRLFIDLLAQQIEDPFQKSVVQKASLALSAGENLLQALLDVSQLDTGRVTVQRRRVTFSEIAAELAAQCDGPARRKGLTLTIVASSAVIDSDPVLLARLLRNLLSNAIKYTDHGRILMGCRKTGGGLRIEVWDTGIGIAADQQQRIFDDFTQLGNAERDQDKGLGIGLAVVRRTAQLLGHQVTVRSWPGRGSVFAVTVGGGFKAVPAKEGRPLTAVPPRRNHG